MSEFIPEPVTTSTGLVPASLEAQALQALLGLLTSATSPDIVQAQAILLRRLALEGDVVPSAVPAPANITQVGGYLNLLGDLGLTDMRTQALAGALGVASPVSATTGTGWAGAGPVLGWATLPDDRPAGPALGVIPATFQVRSDFAAPLKLAFQALHDQGCALPVLAPPQMLPATPAPVPADLLPLLGRAFDIVPGTALANPDTDPIAVAQLPGGSWQVVARQLSTGVIGVSPKPWTALTCTSTACTAVAPPAAGRAYVPLAPVLASAGYVPAAAGYEPATSTDFGWARWHNLTGLVPGVTTLGSELALLWAPEAIAASALASQTASVWNGSSFA